ncbi:ECF-type sigma factor [Microbulbifer rhizosphaerae]|uniref:RNA polymerase sigma factor (TIGR02999 family) n=1 Tax=Microbulbifer rhizosphaerae TaxID=1562603 RepID=A0A7W4ZB88_9GAMM|nr:ECF-type sigma factor [Microbulbifer rhizosphaerae]MBB3063371.1 RNA polymerase sigma factor (TIGR02999 family) [Microbulbifer rhizosphaerae]
MPDNNHITHILNDHQLSPAELMHRLFPVVYNELRRIARNQLKQAWDSRTLCTTSLVNEVWLKLAQGSHSRITNRAHFFAIAAKAMRQIIINYAEQQQALKRGGAWQQVTFDEILLHSDHHWDTLLSVNSALEAITQIDRRLAELVEMRFFAGMTEGEIAKVQGLSERTVRRNWLKAKALISKALNIEGRG